MHCDEKFQPIQVIPILEQGRLALEKANKELGLSFDDRDLDYYTQLFQETMKRNPSEVEIFDIAQSNSEHSRHWFFNGNMVIDGETVPETLFSLVKSTLKCPLEPNVKENSVIAFSDNSSAIRGFPLSVLIPTDHREPTPFDKKEAFRHPVFTAETHNFPCGIAPFPGAE